MVRNEERAHKTTPHTVCVITGAGGRVATEVREELAAEFDAVRLLDITPVDDLRSNERYFKSDLVNRESLRKAFEGADVVIHLGGRADEGEFDTILRANILGTYNVFEEARLSGVRRVVFASSHHVTGFYSADECVSVNDPMRPDTLYGVSKGFGELLGRLYSDKWMIEVVSLRIGVCRASPESGDQLRTWLSHRDVSSLVTSAATASLDVLNIAVYGVSDNSQRFWKTEEFAAIGFRPRDSADAHFEYPNEVPFSYPFQGGGFTTESYRGGAWARD